MNQLNRWISLLLVLILGCLLGILSFSIWDKPFTSVERIAWSPEAQWIGSQQPSYRLYARRTFYLTDNILTAWLRLSADNDFIAYVNGKEVARETSAGQNSRGLASQLSDSEQTFNDSAAYRFIPPEWLHISSTKDWKLTSYINLSPYLLPGKNIIALAIQKGQKNPRVVVEGYIKSVPDVSVIKLTTGATSWKVSTISENHKGNQWFDLNFPDESWTSAKVVGAIREATYSRLSKHLFDRLLQGFWITGNESSHGEIWLRSNWQVPKKRQHAFIRFAGDGYYALLINGLLVNNFWSGDRNQLHMYEVTNFLKTGNNVLAVRTSRPLNPKLSTNNHSPLGFFLDGWVETNSGDITASVATDSNWSTLTEPVSQWMEGSGLGQAVSLLELPQPQKFQRQFTGNAYLLNYPDFLWHNFLWCLGGITITLICTLGLGRFLLDLHNNYWDILNAGAGLLFPGVLFLVGIGLLKHRFAESERGFLFVQHESNPLIMLGFIGIVVLTLLWTLTRRSYSRKNSFNFKVLLFWGLLAVLGLLSFTALSLGVKIAFYFPLTIILFLLFISIGIVFSLLWNPLYLYLIRSFPNTIQFLNINNQWLLLFVLISISLILRVYNLALISFESDENTSLDAARGILQNGYPKMASGIWYTRGPVYHYMLAIWLRVFGNYATNARLLSAIVGTATLFILFLFARKVTGKVWIALVVVAILAIDPMELWYSRFIRFYQLLQFISIFSIWTFLKGFIYRDGKIYQHLFFIIFTLNLLTQELSVTLLPCFFIGFLWFYRPFVLSRDWSIICSTLLVLIIYIYNGIFFTIKCLTPLVAISSTTDAQLKFHLSNIAAFISILFVAPNRSFTIYSFFFILGFIYVLKQKNKVLIFLFCIVCINILLLTVLVFQSAGRYIQHIYPLFILLAVYSCISVTESLGRKFEVILNNLLPLRNIALAFLSLLIFNNIEIDRVVAAYQEVNIPRHTDVAQYICEHRQSGDVIMTTVPAVYANSCKLDYYLPHRVSVFDALYTHEGRLIERWAGGVLVNNVDQISHILEKANRVWIHIHDRKLPQDANLAELQKYTENLGQPIIETFGVRLRLWTSEDGFIPRISNKGRDLGTY